MSSIVLLFPELSPVVRLNECWPSVLLFEHFRIVCTYLFIYLSIHIYLFIFLVFSTMPFKVSTSVPDQLVLFMPKCAPPLGHSRNHTRHPVCFE